MSFLNLFRSTDEGQLTDGPNDLDPVAAYQVDQKFQDIMRKKKGKGFRLFIL